MTTGTPRPVVRRLSPAPPRPLQGLGELESRIMDLVWSCDESLRVRDILDGLLPSRQLAYTTVMTVMDNLRRKGWLSRELDGRAYRYRARRSRLQAATDALRDLLVDSGDPAAALLHFAREATDAESRALARGLKERRAGR